MDWMVVVGETWLSTFARLAVLAVAFGIVARWMPCNPGMYWWKDLRAVFTDFVYWFVVPLFLRVCHTALLLGGCRLLCDGREPHLLPVAGLPLWQQVLLVLLIQDVMLYWLHRLFHGRVGWKFHAVHHSPTVLDWTSTARFHPVNNVLTFILADVAILLMGFSPAALIVLAPFNLVYSALVHANLNWTFGPFRYLLASPVFHRWHHTTEAEGLDKNFASTFPLLDVVFGTYYMPAGKLPEHFGNGERDYPQDFWGQFVHPFRCMSSSAGPIRWAGGTLLAVSGVAVLGVLDLDRSLQKTLAPEPSEQQTEQVEASPASPALRLGVMRFSAVLGVAISPDGTQVIAGSEDGTVKVYDAAGGRETLTLTGHTRQVRGVALSADGRCIVSAGLDRTVRVWDAATGRQRHLLPASSGVLSVAVSADGAWVVAGCADGTVKVWDGESGAEKLTVTRAGGAVPGVAISADGKRIVAAGEGRAIGVLDGRTGQVEKVLKGHADLVYGVAISPDATRIASAGFDEKVRLWDAETGRELQVLTGHTGPVYGVAISRDAARIVSGGKDGTVRVWDARTGRQTASLTGHTDAVMCVAAGGDGRRIVSGSQDLTLRAWDVAAGR